MKSRTRRLELLINVAILAAALVVVGLIVKRYLVAAHERADETPVSFDLRPGATFPMRDIDWARNGRTIVLALANDCAYCTASAPLYQTLARLRSDQTKFVALVDQTASEGENYLRGLGVAVDEIRHVPLYRAGLKVIPTLALVDRDGAIINIWYGKLSETEEAALLSLVGGGSDHPAVAAAQTGSSSDGADHGVAAASPDNSGSRATAKTGAVQTAPLASASAPTNVGRAADAPLLDERAGIVSEADLRRAREAGQRLILLDVRERAEFARAHADGARNIPIDELETRALDELSPTDLVVISCRCYADELSKNSRRLLEKQGFTRVLVLHDAASEKPCDACPQ